MQKNYVIHSGQKINLHEYTKKKSPLDLTELYHVIYDENSIKYENK